MDGFVSVRLSRGSDFVPPYVWCGVPLKSAYECFSHISTKVDGNAIFAKNCVGCAIVMLTVGRSPQRCSGPTEGSLLVKNTSTPKPSGGAYSRPWSLSGMEGLCSILMEDNECYGIKACRALAVLRFALFGGYWGKRLRDMASDSIRLTGYRRVVYGIDARGRSTR